MTAAIIILVIMICVNHRVGMHIINNDDVEISIDNDLQVAIITAALPPPQLPPPSPFPPPLLRPSPPSPSAALLAVPSS